MTPPASFVADLHAYDPKLRVRWARHSEKWFIERKLDQRNPTLLAEQPLPEGRHAVHRDLWDGWRDDYVHVLTVPRELLHWNLVVEHLTKFDAWRQGGMKAIADQLDAQDDALERAGDRKIDNFAEAATDDAYEMLAWGQKRRISVPTEMRDGYVVQDRRVKV